MYAPVDRVTDSQGSRQSIVRAVIDDVRTVTGRSRQNGWLASSALVCCANGVLNPFVERLRQPIVAPGVEIHPSPLIVIAMVGDQQDLTAEDSGIGDHIAPRLDH